MITVHVYPIGKEVEEYSFRYSLPSCKFARKQWRMRTDIYKIKVWKGTRVPNNPYADNLILHLV